MGDAPQGFLGMFLKPFPSSEPPAVNCCPLRPLWLLLWSPPGPSPSVLGPVVSWCLSKEHPELPEPPCALISLSLLLSPKEISPGRSCSSCPRPGCHPGGATCGGDTRVAATPAAAQLWCPLLSSPSPRGAAEQGGMCWEQAFVGYFPPKVGDGHPTSPTGPAFSGVGTSQT